MANALYDYGRERFATAGIDWVTDMIKVALIDTGAYSVNLASHQFFSSVPGGAVVGSVGTLASKTAAAGVCDAADLTFATVSGASIEAIVIFKDTGLAATSPLIAYIDTATGLALTPNGGDITIQWDNGTSRIFKL